ncbi:MAG: DUF2269 domain-containing protein [Caulobacterales bacterium]|nr:DUF2269 domain-containing protein [Caulobacterales bacterium]
MTLYVMLKLVHILSGAVLFGTGAGIAFFMLAAHRTGDTRTVAATARMVVLADFVFTTPAVIVQPLSGIALILLQGYPPTAAWLLVVYGLYLLIGVCWLPVVVIQMRIRRLAEAAAAAGQALPLAYHRLFRIWFLLGWPAFAGVVAIYGLMIARPA